MNGTKQILKPSDIKDIFPYPNVAGDWGVELVAQNLAEYLAENGDQFKCVHEFEYREWSVSKMISSGKIKSLAETWVDLNEMPYFDTAMKYLESEGMVRHFSKQWNL